MGPVPSCLPVPSRKAGPFYVTHLILLDAGGWDVCKWMMSNLQFSDSNLSISIFIRMGSIDPLQNHSGMTGVVARYFHIVTSQSQWSRNRKDGEFELEIGKEGKEICSSTFIYSFGLYASLETNTLRRDFRKMTTFCLVWSSRTRGSSLKT